MEATSEGRTVSPTTGKDTFRLDVIALVGEEVAEEGELQEDRYQELKAREQFVLTVSVKGFGKRSSAYEYRRTGRGGQGMLAQDLTRKGGRLVAAFPVEDGDGILLVTDQGQLIRCPVAQIRIAARNTQGVIVFRTGKDEHVVGVERLAEAGAGDSDNGDGESGEDTSPATDET
jgi:DNA gyrase subunit A